MSSNPAQNATPVAGPRYLPIGEAANFLGVSIGILRKFEETGKIVPLKTLSGERRYSLTDLEKVKNTRNEDMSDESPKEQTLTSILQELETDTKTGEAAGGGATGGSPVEHPQTTQSRTSDGTRERQAPEPHNAPLAGPPPPSPRQAPSSRIRDFRAKGVNPYQTTGLLSVEQVASKMGVSSRTIRRLIAKGKLRPATTGKYGSILIPAAHVDGLVNGYQKPSDSPIALPALAPSTEAAQVSARKLFFLNAAFVVIWLAVLGSSAFLGYTFAPEGVKEGMKGKIAGLLFGEGDLASPTPTLIEQTKQALITDYLKVRDGNKVDYKVFFEEGIEVGTDTLTIDDKGALTTSEPLTITDSSVSSLNIGGGMIAGTGNVYIIDKSGRIPALTSTYIADLDATKLTGKIDNADHLDNIDSSSFLRSNESDTAEGAINFTASPGSVNVGGGPVYINPGAATSNYTLLGVAVNASQRFRVDAEGDTGIAGTLDATGATTLSSTLAVTGNSTLTGDLAVNGGDLTTSATSFNLVNATATTVNFAGAATTVGIGASTGTTTINNALAVTGASTLTGNLTLTGDLAVNGGDITTAATTWNFDLPSSGGTIYFRDGTSNLMTIADSGSAGNVGVTGTLAVTSDTTLTGDLAVNGGDLTTSATTFNLVNATATTVNFAGAGTTVGIGAATGTTTINNATTAVTGNLTVAGTTGGTLSGVGAGITFSGTGNHDITASSGTLRLGALTLTGDIVASAGGVDMGSSGTRLGIIYADEVNATTLVGTLTGGNLTAATFTINSDNATADTENSDIAFERGSITPNALIAWDATNDEIDFNSSINLTGTTSLTTTPLLALATSAAHTTGDIFDLTATYTPTLGGTQSAIDVNLTNSPSTNANTLRGIDIGFTDAGSLANTVYGLYVDVTTANASDTTYAALLSGGNVGINDASPDARLNILATTEQLRLDYDDSNYASFTVGATGILTIDATGTAVGLTVSDALTVSGASITASSASLALGGAVSGATTITGSGNINTTGGALQTNSVTRIDNSGNVTAGTITGTGDVTIDTNTLFVDTAGNEVGIGDATPDGTLDVTGASNNANKTGVAVFSATDESGIGLFLDNNTSMLSYSGTDSGWITPQRSDDRGFNFGNRDGLIFWTGASTQASTSYTSKVDADRYFVIDPNPFGVTQEPVPGSTFTIGANTYTIKSYRNANARLFVYEAISGEAATGTLTNIIYSTRGLVVDTAGALTLGTDLAVSEGGTGASTFTDAGVLIGNITGAIQVTTAGTSGQVLTSNGAGVDPTFQAAAGGLTVPTAFTAALSNGF